MFELHPSFAYPIFAVWVALIWLAVYVLLPETRRAQLWMSGWGLIGGPFINAVYETDFWRPPSLIPFFPIESAVFGAGFLGTMMALMLEMSGTWWLYPENGRAVRRSTKVWTLIMTVLTALVVHQLGFNSVFATAVGLFVGAGMMLYSRRDLWRPMYMGVGAALMTYIVMVGGFVFLLAGNADALGRELSVFYAARGAGVTTILLALWTIAFGAFFGPFYLWAKNLRQVN